jgi:hypothetical protein
VESLVERWVYGYGKHRWTKRQRQSALKKIEDIRIQFVRLLEEEIREMGNDPAFSDARLDAEGDKLFATSELYKTIRKGLAEAEKELA